MRYTKLALLTFGAGLVLGLIVVVGEISPLARIASGLMALGIIGIPAGIVADWRLATRPVRASPRKRVKKPVHRRTATSARRPPRQRKRAAPKR